MLVFFSLPRYNEEDGDEEMKVCLYTEGEKLFSKSGLGKAIRHQEKALESVGVSYTTNIKDDYDVLHVNFYGPNSFALAKMAKKHGKKIVYHAHSTEEDFKNGFIFCKQISPAFKKWLIKCYSLGDVIITPTPYSKRLLEGYGIKKKIYAISNGIELDKFKCDKSQRKTFRKRYNFKEDDKVIIGIGLYIERKGIVDFVELAKTLDEAAKTVGVNNLIRYLVIVVVIMILACTNLANPIFAFCGYMGMKVSAYLNPFIRRAREKVFKI